MKILHISPYAFRGGCEKNCYLFIKASLQMHHTVLVLGVEGPMTSDWEQLGVQVVHLNVIEKSIFTFKKQIQNKVDNKTYDLIIYWSTVRLSAVFGAVKRATRKVRVYVGNPSQYTSLQLLKEKIFEVCWGRPKDVVFMPCSQHALRSFEKLYYFKSFPYKVALNPIELPLNRVKHQFLRDKNIHVGMVARLDPIKNHELLLHAFALVSQKFPSMILHLLGDGSLRKALLELTEQLQLTEKVIFHGDVKDVYQHLAKWDAFIYSTTMREGLGSSVMEAMANGLPCLLPDLPMIREIVSNKAMVQWFKADSLEDFVESWIKLFNETDKFEIMSNTVYLCAQSFHPKVYVQEFLGI